MNKDFDNYLDKIAENLPPATEAEIDRTYQLIAEKEGLDTNNTAVSTTKPAEQKKRRFSSRFGVLAAACLIVVVGAVVILTNQDTSNPGLNNQSGTTYAAADYRDIYAAIDSNILSNHYNNYASDDIAIEGDSAPLMAEEAPADMAMPESAEMENGDASTSTGRGGSSDYSQTNVQVENIDEGDIVKTDGEYIYLLRDSQLFISSTDGKSSELLSTTSVLPGYQQMEANNYSQYTSELYISGDQLAIISTKYSWTETDSNYGYYNSSETCQVLLYDVSDPSNPQQLTTIGQDGYYNTSRLVGDTLYIISNYYVYSEIEEDRPETYVPATYRNDEMSLVPAHDICILPAFDSTGYTVISSIDLSSQELIDTSSVLGGSNTVYMSYDSLYTTYSNYETESKESYREDQYTVTEYSEKNTTQIMRFALDQGAIELSAEGEVPGYLLNQFSLDEYDGYLRVVTTIDDYSYKIYRDEKRGWEHYEWADDESSNALFVLDADMNISGSITDLAPGERIYSARFSGDIGYFVTFRQVDPLFAVDLADPENPTILSELKIPGFSQYLHNYSEGRLFGLGMDADEETGRTNGMKMTMFNVEDPADVSEKHTLLLDSNYSEALYNHKAILISAAKDLIAFPVQDGYDVYGYDDESGFYKKGHFTSGAWSYNTRGLYVDDYIYICTTNDISIIEMDSLDLVKTIELPIEENERRLYDYYY